MATVIKIEGLKETLDSLAKFGDGLKDLTPFMKVAGLVILESVQRNFIEGGRPAWTPLRPATIKRRRGFGDVQILRDTGLLMNSLAPASPSVWRLEPLSVEVGTNVPYAGYHQLGIGVPERPFLMVQPEDEETLMKVAQDEIIKKAKEAGL